MLRHFEKYFQIFFRNDILVTLVLPMNASLTFDQHVHVQQSGNDRSAITINSYRQSMYLSVFFS